MTVECEQEREGYRLQVIARRSEIKALTGRLDSALGLLRDVATSGVSFEDERVSYVEVQIDAETWTKLQQYGVVEIPSPFPFCEACGTWHDPNGKHIRTVYP